MKTIKKVVNLTEDQHEKIKAEADKVTVSVAAFMRITTLNAIEQKHGETNG